MTLFDQYFVSSEGEFSQLYKGQAVSSKPNLVPVLNVALSAGSLVPAAAPFAQAAQVAMMFFDTRSEEQRAYSKYIELKNQTKQWLLQAPSWTNQELNQRAIETMNAIDVCKAKYAARDSAGGRYMYHYMSRLAYLQAVKQQKNNPSAGSVKGATDNGTQNQSFFTWLMNLFGL
jgi:hypothetical protein